MTDRENEVANGLEMALVASPPDLEVRVLMKRSFENKVNSKSIWFSGGIFLTYLSL